LVRRTPGIAGLREETSSTSISVVGPLALNVNGSVGVDWDGSDGGLFAFQGRWMMAIDSPAFRPRRRMLESSEVLLSTSWVVPGRAKVGWLDLFNKRGKGMPKGCTGSIQLTGARVASAPAGP
jgi:hypothetical protein